VVELPLATLEDVLQDAAAGGYAVGAFNANNLEYVQAIVAAAEDERAPVVVQASQGAIRHAGLEYIARIVRLAAERADVPVVLHLDHGRDLTLLKRCLGVGFTSVMFDGSHLPLEENIRLTAEVVRWARRVGISVEGELGQVPRSSYTSLNELAGLLTDPDEAARFVTETGVNALAVSVGSVHQMTRQQAVLDVRRVRAIREATGVPLVLHGSSGVTDESLQAVIREGIRKVNFATALNQAFRRGLEETLAASAEPDPRPALSRARELVREVVRDKIRLLGAAGRA